MVEWWKNPYGEHNYVDPTAHLYRSSGSNSGSSSLREDSYYGTNGARMSQAALDAHNEAVRREKNGG